MIDQITVFLENEKGRLASLCRAMADAGINMHALTVADSSDYGVARIICDNPEKALSALSEAGYRANITKVSAIAVDNRPGGLAGLLEVLDQSDINIEYGYCFTAKGDKAVDILKIRNPDRAAVVLSEAGYKVLYPEDVYSE